MWYIVQAAITSFLSSSITSLATVEDIRDSSYCLIIDQSKHRSMKIDKNYYYLRNSFVEMSLFDCKNMYSSLITRTAKIVWIPAKAYTEINEIS